MGAFMKRLLVVAAATLVTLVATNSFAAKQPTSDQLCAVKGALAGVVMQMRQMGGEMSEQMNTIPKLAGGSREMVVKAYNYPRYSTSNMQRKAVEDFRNEIELECFNH